MGIGGEHCRVGNSLFCSKSLILKRDCERFALVALYKRANRYRPGTLLFAITKKMKVGLKPISLRHSVNVTAKIKNRNFCANISAKSNPYSKCLNMSISDSDGLV